MKQNLYITRDLEIKRDSNVLKIDDKKIPISIVNNLFIIGNAKITDSAKKLLLKNSRSIFYLSNKYELLGILTPPIFNSDYRLRLLQYKNHQNLELAKWIVLKKIEAIEKYTSSLKRYKDKLKEVNSLNELLGIEGSASVYMYDKFRKNLQDIMIDDFYKREYNPPKDRVNSLLSFLYTLYYSFVYSEIVSYGYDPYIGFLHIKRGRHAVFASDMMEEARVEITFLAVEILKEIYLDGFDNIYLTYEAKKFVLKKFDEFILNYKNTILEELKDRLC